MNSGGQALLERLETDRKPRRGSGREAVDARMGYVQERLPSLDYPAFGARGWHIGSRAMEASCKTLPDRMKSLEPLLGAATLKSW